MRKIFWKKKTLASDAISLKTHSKKILPKWPLFVMQNWTQKFLENSKNVYFLKISDKKKNDLQIFSIKVYDFKTNDFRKYFLKNWSKKSFLKNSGCSKKKNLNVQKIKFENSKKILKYVKFRIIELLFSRSFFNEF